MCVLGLQCWKLVQEVECLFTPYHIIVDGNGDWSTDGCNLTTFNNSTNVVGCECDHLTNFACLVVSDSSTKYYTCILYVGHFH